MKTSVYLTLPGGEQLRVGQLDFGEIVPSPRGPSYRASFKYASAWLKHKAYFPLDPESLGVASTDSVASTEALRPPLSVFLDALPDDWGRRLLVARHGLVGVQQADPFLLLKVGSSGPGALSFFEPGVKPLPKQTAGSVDLNELMASAQDFEAGRRDMSPEMLRLYSAGGTPGGARPKVLVAAEGREWIAKFPSRQKDGGVDVVGLEGACMTVASNAGLIAAPVRLAGFPGGNVLMVERFDIGQNEAGRHHYISLHTLCKESPGRYVTTYKEVMEKIRVHSSQPQVDVPMFFRQMTLNAVIGNTDDHLKNFAMIHDGFGYRLSPAFDLVPDVAEKREHSLFFQYQPQTGGRELVSIGDAWGVPDARQIVREVSEAAADFGAVAQALRVAPAGIERFAGPIESRATAFLEEIRGAGSRPLNKSGR